MRAPSPRMGTPVLERLMEPLYSAAEYDSAAAVSQLDFFNYLVGQTISGSATGVATHLETNMELPNALPSPKQHRIRGIRLVYSPVDEDGSTELDNQVAASANADQRDNMLAIIFASYLEFAIGNKPYAQHPLWFFPSQIGLQLGGDSDYSIGDTEERRLISAPSLVGQGWECPGQLEIFLRRCSPSGFRSGRGGTSPG